MLWIGAPRQPPSPALREMLLTLAFCLASRQTWAAPVPAAPQMTLGVVAHLYLSKGCPVYLELAFLVPARERMRKLSWLWIESQGDVKE
uniref:Uncharacterized protein n=1 Tax=Sphaerodactylus townsendi TaxID=933632 RepID=A0ACB8FYI7_9SAUR